MHVIYFTLHIYPVILTLLPSWNFYLWYLALTKNRVKYVYRYNSIFLFSSGDMLSYFVFARFRLLKHHYIALVVIWFYICVSVGFCWCLLIYNIYLDDVNAVLVHKCDVYFFVIQFKTFSYLWFSREDINQQYCVIILFYNN